MEQSQLLAHCGSSKITRDELKVIPTPEGSATHQPVPHVEIVGALVETLSYRQISVVREEYAVSSDGMKMFGYSSWKRPSTDADSQPVSETRTTSPCALPSP